jgi:signal peptidase I
VALSFKADSAKVAVREYLDAFIVAGLASLFLITFVIRTFYIPSDSMLPTLQQNDVLLVNEFEYRVHAPARGDIVVFKPPIASSTDFIKRVIAVPGDTLRVSGGVVYVNGKPLDESYISEAPSYELRVGGYGITVDTGNGPQRLNPAQADIPPRALWQAPDRVPAGFYFVMGDNRNDSDDSHIWGFAQLHGKFAAGPLAQTKGAAQFTGRAFLLLWPLNRLRVLH